MIHERGWGTMVEVRPGGQELGVRPSRTRETQQPEPKRRFLLTLTYIGILFFAVLYFFRPEDWFLGLTSVPLAKAAGFITGITLLAAIFGEGVRLSKSSKYLLALFIYLCIGIPFSTWPGGTFAVLIKEFSKYVLVSIASACALTTITRLRRLVLIHTTAMVFLAAMSLIFPDRTAGRMYGAGFMFDDPNDFALNLCVALPLCVAFLLWTRSLIVKLLWAAASAAILFAIVFTYSRGGALALFALIPCMLLRFRIKVGTRFVLLFLLLLSFSGAVIAGGSSAYFQRLKTIFSPDSEASSAARKELLTTSLKLSVRHPLLGVGVGRFGEVTRFWHETHNTYTQLSAEAGIPALLLFLLIMREAFKNLRPYKKGRYKDQHKSSEKGAWCLGNGVYCALVTYLVGAFFLSTAFWLLPYLLSAYATVLYAISPQAEPVVSGGGAKTA